MRKPLHVLLIAASTAHRKRFLRELTALDLTEGQPKVLAHLLREEGLLQKDLAQRCGVEPATMTALLRRMEDRGLIRREELRVSGGKRAYGVYLTQEGKERGEQALKLIDQLEEQSYRGFSEEEKDQLTALLARVAENIQQEQ